MSDKEIKIDTVSVNDLDSAPTAGKAACTDSENIPGDKGGEPIDMAEQIEKLSAQVTELTDKLHEVFGFRTDTEIIKKSKMRSIIKKSKEKQ